LLFDFYLNALSESGIGVLRVERSGTRASRRSVLFLILPDQSSKQGHGARNPIGGGEIDMT